MYPTAVEMALATPFRIIEQIWNAAMHQVNLEFAETANMAMAIISASGCRWQSIAN